MLMQKETSADYSKPMETKKITSNDYLVSQWSGGLTTQLLIAPPDAVYQPGNFDYRISSATIEIEESDFTPLPGYQRIILPLQGKLLLTNHTSGEEVELDQFQTYAFSGSDKISSHQPCTDFNIIYKESLKSDLIKITIQSPNIEIESNNDYYLHAVENISFSMRVNHEEERWTLAQGQGLWIRQSLTNESATLIFDAQDSQNALIALLAKIEYK